MFLSRSACWRTSSRSTFLRSISRSSTLRRSSTISSGVGLGEISRSGWPRLTKSPTPAKRRRTTPARIDLTLTSTRGSMVPTARALSTRDPRATPTAFGPSFFLPPRLPVAVVEPQAAQQDQVNPPFGGGRHAVDDGRQVEPGFEVVIRVDLFCGDERRPGELGRRIHRQVGDAENRLQPRKRVFRPEQHLAQVIEPAVRIGCQIVVE